MRLAFLSVNALVLSCGVALADDFVRVDASALRVRGGPGTNHSALGTVSGGTTLRVLERSGPWIKVRQGSREGWVHGDHVDPLEAKPGKVTARGGLNVRSGPGTRYRVIGTLDPGAEVAILDTKSGWNEVAYRGSTGWIASTYVDPLEPAAREGAAGRLNGLTDDGDDDDAEVDEDDADEVDNDGDESDQPEANSDLQPETRPQPRPGSVPASSPRTQPGASSPASTPASPPASSPASPPASSPASPPASSPASPPASSPASPAGTADAGAEEPTSSNPGTPARVTARSGLRVRSGPGTRHRVLGSLRYGAQVRIVGERGLWKQIPYRGSTGWVYGNHLATGGAAADDSADDSAANSGANPDASSGNGRVIYQRRVTDGTTRAALQRLADALGKTVVVHSGDRNYVPRGGSRTSLHLAHRAADFHVRGLSDADAFSFLMRNHSRILGGGSYEVIHHRPGTNTGGPHLHLGNYGDRRGTYYKTEVGGRYRRVAHRR